VTFGEIVFSAMLAPRLWRGTAEDLIFIIVQPSGGEGEICALYPKGKT
jgi:hypothetical protein